MRLWGLVLLASSILYGQGDYIVNLRRLNGITLTGANVVDGPNSAIRVTGSGTFNTDPIDRAVRVLGRAFLRNPGDTANMGDTTTPMRIDPTGVTTQPVQGGLADNGVAASTNRAGTLPAIAQSNLPATGIAGRDAALLTDLNRRLITAILPSGFATYSASKQGLVPAASPTDISVLPGNATNTVVVVRVEMSCTQTTAGVIDVQLIKRSTADSAGTSTAITAVPLDSNNAAAVSVPLTYTANPTVGTAVGTVDAKKIFVPAPATTGNDFYLWMPDVGQSVTLRGTAQQIAINLNGVTLTGGNCNTTFKWIETTGL